MKTLRTVGLAVLLAACSGCGETPTWKTAAERESQRQGRGLQGRGELRMVHEYLDLDENGLFDTHIVVYETGNGKRTIDSIDVHPRIVSASGDTYFEHELSREDIESLPLVGDERRFLSKNLYHQLK
jgi:hypothetical protein